VVTAGCEVMRQDRHRSHVVLPGCGINFRKQAAQAAFVRVAEGFSPASTPIARKMRCTRPPRDLAKWRERWYP